MTNSDKLPAQPPHRPGRPTLEAAKAISSRIVTAAADLFVELGFERTTMDEVARRAHVSKRTLYSRFAGKEDLFVATAERVGESKLSELQSIRITARALPERLEQLALTLISRLAEPRFIAFERIVAAEARNYPSLAIARVQSGLSRMTSIARRILRDEPPFKDMQETDLTLQAEIFVAMAILPSLRRALFADGAIENTDVNFIRRSIDVFLLGNAGNGGNARPSASRPASGSGAGDMTGETGRGSRARRVFRKGRGTGSDGFNTRDRILQAAMKRFARGSYDDTGLRDIAADVGIDVAYVHRSFGSKEALFIRALEEASGNAWPGMLDSGAPLPRAIARLFAETADLYEGKVHPLDIMIRSLASASAAGILDRKIRNDLVEPLASRLDEPRDTRAAMIAAVLLGIGICRNMLQFHALSDDREAAGILLEAVTEAIMRTALPLRSV